MGIMGAQGRAGTSRAKIVDGEFGGDHMVAANPKTQIPNGGFSPDWDYHVPGFGAYGKAGGGGAPKSGAADKVSWRGSAV